MLAVILAVSLSANGSLCRVPSGHAACRLPVNENVIIGALALPVITSSLIDAVNLIFILHGEASPASKVISLPLALPFLIGASRAARRCKDSRRRR